jgi:hypothetical protein
MNFQFHQWDIVITEESYDHMGSGDQPVKYQTTYRLGDGQYVPAVMYAVRVDGPAGLENSCLIMGPYVGTLLHKNSIVLADNHLFLAISAWICCLEIPNLKLIWQQQVDFAACFGIYLSPDGEGLLSHGEVEIAKIGFGGEIEWRASGKDIFTGGFVLASDHIDVTDFNNEKYRILISTGQISLNSP